MEIVPRFNEQVITASNVKIEVNPEDRDRALKLVEWSSNVREVTDDDTFQAAREAAGALKALLDEIEMSRKLAKTPFTTVGRTIDDVARKVAAPVETEQDRVLALLGGYVEKLKKAREAEEKKKAEEVRRKQEESDRKVREAQKQTLLAQEQLRKAQGEIEKARHREELQRRENVLLQQQLEQELAGDAAEMEMMLEPPRKGLLPGGRVNDDYEFELVNVQLTCEARCYRLLRWELDILACKDAVKNLVELNPGVAPELPGIKVTPKLSVSVKAAARIK